MIACICRIKCMHIKPNRISLQQQCRSCLKGSISLPVSTVQVCQDLGTMQDSSNILLISLSESCPGRLQYTGHLVLIVLLLITSRCRKHFYFSNYLSTLVVGWTWLLPQTSCGLQRLRLKPKPALDVYELLFTACGCLINISCKSQWASILDGPTHNVCTEKVERRWNFNLKVIFNDSKLRMIKIKFGMTTKLRSKFNFWSRAGFYMSLTFGKLHAHAMISGTHLCTVYLYS